MDTLIPGLRLPHDHCMWNFGVGEPKGGSLLNDRKSGDAVVGEELTLL
jgi:hypothetical protein